MAAAHLLGIDIGTSACKTVVVDQDGKVQAAAAADYPLSTPRPGWSEQDPAHWWQAVRKTVAEVVAKTGGAQLKAVGLSGQMHGLVPLDGGGAVLRPAILWNDQRNGAECRWAVERAGGLDGLLALTNNQMLVGYTGGKILWLREHEPQHYERMRKFLNPKDYIRYCLTGAYATEVSDASGTGLFDVAARRWSDRLLDLLAIDRALIPDCHESAAVSATVSAAIAAELGLPADLPVVGGGGDAVIQTTGSGVIAPGVMQTTLGTAGICAAALDRCYANPDGRLQIFCNNSPDRWHCMGVTLSGGGALRWFKDLLQDGVGAEVAFDRLLGLAEGAAPGADGLFFVPYLMGERCPHPDPDARAGFIGLTQRHGLAEMARAVLEGVVFGLRDMAVLIEALGLATSEIRTSGGGTASPLWRQIHADVFGSDVITVNASREGGAYGAALVAGVGVGVWDDLDAAIGGIEVETRDRCDPARHAHYAQAFAIYQDFYRALKPQFDRIAALAGEAG